MAVVLMGKNRALGGLLFSGIKRHSELFPNNFGTRDLRQFQGTVYTVDRLMAVKGQQYGPFHEAPKAFGRELSEVKPHELHFVMLWGNTHVVYRVPFRRNSGSGSNSGDGYRVVFRGRVGQLTGSYRAKGSRRKRAYGREGLAYWAVERALAVKGETLGPVRMVVKLRGFGSGRRGVVKGLRRASAEFVGQFVLLKLIEARSLAHNGCRPRKSRRV